MKLYILRHGQAEPPVVDDYSRQLTQKGQSDVQALAGKLAEQGITFEKAWVSPFIRTRQTFDVFCSAFGHDVPFEYADALLSESSVQDTSDFLLKELGDQRVESALLVSHQPLVSSLIAYLVDGNTHEAFNYPMSPASLTVLSFDVPSAKVAQFQYQLHPPYEC